MAAGIVYHNVTTSSGVTFSIACWVPNTATPDVGAIPVQLPVNSSGAEITPATATQLTSLMALIGEVQASPTALTVLDRLKSLGTFTDGVEALIGSTNTALGTLNAQTDTLEALIAATNAAIASATVGTTAPGTEAAQMVGMQGATAMVPIATVGKTVVFALTPTLDTAVYAAGDVLFDRTVMTSLLRINDGTGVLQSIQVIDQDDNGIALDFYIHTTNQTLGTFNTAPSITDANAAELLGPFSIATTDYKDLGGAKVGKISNIGQPIKAVTGGKDLYISAVISAGTPTFTAAGIKLRIGVLLD